MHVHVPCLVSFSTCIMGYYHSKLQEVAQLLQTKLYIQHIYTHYTDTCTPIMYGDINKSFQILPWLPSPDTPTRGLVVWPEPEVVEASITLYKVIHRHCLIFICIGSSLVCVSVVVAH